MVVDPQTRAVTPFVAMIDGKPMIGPNDLIFGPSGEIYFTDMGNSDLIRPTGRLVRLTPQGEAQILIDGLAAPNGLALAANGMTLYLNMFRENAVWQMRVDASGASRVSRFIQLSGGLGPDGLLLDRDGNLLIAHGGLGCVWRYSARGEPDLRIQAPNSYMITNIAFGIDDPEMLYMVDSTGSRILRAKLDIPGALPYSHTSYPG